MGMVIKRHLFVKCNLIWLWNNQNSQLGCPFRNFNQYKFVEIDADKIMFWTTRAKYWCWHAIEESCNDIHYFL